MDQPVAVMSTLVGTIITDVQSIHPGIPEVQIAMSIAVACGGIVTFMGLARLGFIVDFIPLPSIAAFTTGSAITISSGLIKQLLGETADFSTRGPAYRVIIDSLKHLPTSSRYDAAMGVSALGMLYLIRIGCSYGARKHPQHAKTFFFISSLRAAMVIFTFTAISAAVNIHHPNRPVFAIVGAIPRGFQDAGVPKLSSDAIKTFAPQLPACVIVLLLEHIAISKSFGRINNYTIDPSQELIAIGITNLLGPFLGGYTATGSFSRSAIQSKSGARTPFAGVITAIVVLIALYALTEVLCFTPKASLAGVIIHAVGDLITSPNTIYQFWLIAPSDAIIFAIGLLVALVDTIPNSIYATVALSLLVFLFRHAKAHGQFLARTWIGPQDAQRPLFLPADGCPELSLEQPRPGVFVYQFPEGLSYSNSNHYTELLVQTILRSTRCAGSQIYATKGDRPWNDPGFSDKDHESSNSRLPLLRAVVLDFSCVNHVDVTCIQNLMDVQKQLDHRTTAPAVQWHFANIKNRWTKRALAAAGFGYPHTLTETTVLEGNAVSESEFSSEDIKDVEKGIFSHDKRSQCVQSCEKRVSVESSLMGVLEREDRPFFHVDLISAMESVDAYFDQDLAVRFDV